MILLKLFELVLISVIVTLQFEIVIDIYVKLTL